MNVNPSERRGTVFSAFTLCDDLGKGLGPSIASGLHKGGRLHLLYIITQKSRMVGKGLFVI